jgi:ketosteroid isomerase-like protein
MIEEHRIIEALYAKSEAALASGDLAALSSCYIDDAIQFPPNRSPLVGWTEIQESLERELDGITFSSEVQISKIVIFGVFAYTWGSYQGASSSDSGGAPTTTSGSFLDVLTKQSDGSWRIACSAWSNHELDGGGE